MTRARRLGSGPRDGDQAVAQPTRYRRAADPVTLTATVREVALPPGRALLVSAWHDAAGELVRFVLATRSNDDPPGAVQRALVLPPAAVAGLAAALAELVP